MLIECHASQEDANQEDAKKRTVHDISCNVSQVMGEGEDVKAQDPRTEESWKGFDEIFDPLPPDLPPDRGVKHTVDTGNDPPVSLPEFWGNIFYLTSVPGLKLPMVSSLR